MTAREPVFNVPGVVTGLLAAVIGVHVARQFLSPETDNWFVALMAFIPWRYDGGAAELPGGTTAAATSFLTHMLVHGEAQLSQMVRILRFARRLPRPLHGRNTDGQQDGDDRHDHQQFDQSHGASK